MIFPLKELIGYVDNMYGVTAASSRRSYQLSILHAANDDQVKSLIDANDGKVVSLAARQIFTGEVQFRLEAE